MPASPPQPGWVYILTNAAMPRMVKIGLTTRTPKERAAELSGATGVPLPFVVAWARAVPDCAAVERIVHRMLDDKRVNGKRESFWVDVKTARQVIEAAAGSMLCRRWHSPPVRPARKAWQGRGSGRSWGRRRRRGDLTYLGVGVAVALLMLVLVRFQPPLPAWLGPVGQAFAAIERLGG